MLLRQISFEEVELHRSAHDCWVVLGPVGRKRVYDVTAFLEDHPGGPELLLDLAGQDAHDEFEDIGHSRAAREMLHELCIGELQHDRDAHARREARNQERRSLLLMQAPELLRLDADSSSATASRPATLRRTAVAITLVLAGLGLVVAVAAILVETTRL